MQFAEGHSDISDVTNVL